MSVEIGTEYRKHSFNCAHFVAEWYKEHNITNDIPVGDVFGRHFVVWMRRHFKEVKKPTDHSLVLMVNHDDSYHVGVYFNFMVNHNFKPVLGSGSVCKWTMSAVKAYYKEVRFYTWLK